MRKLEIEIFQDNLLREDINDLTDYSRKVILLNTEKILVLYNKDYDYYYLPCLKITAEQILDFVLKEDLIKTLTIKQYSTNLTLITDYYYTKELKIQDFISSNDSHSVSLKWFDVVEALDLFDTHDTFSKDAPEIMSRDFLAIINSL